MDILDGLIDNKKLKILGLFAGHPESIYHIKKVSEETAVPLATTFRIINSLVRIKIIEVRKISKFKIYSLAKNNKTDRLRELL